MPNDYLQLLAGSGWENGAPKKRPVFQIGRDPDGVFFIPDGWASDLHYYLANNHPFYGIIACDPNHPLSRWERLAVELATVGCLVCAEHWRAVRQDLQYDHRFDTDLEITIFGMIVWWVFFLLFTCPKLGTADKSDPNTTNADIHKAYLWSKAGQFAGSVLLVLCILYLAYVAYEKVFVHEQRFAQVSLLRLVLSRLQSYVITVCLVVGIYFCPVAAWGQTDIEGSFTPGDYIGLGQWRMEKQRYQNACARFLQNKLEDEKSQSPLRSALAAKTSAWAQKWGFA